VPDWPTTYGYNMFFFPISKWTGGIFYEHTHRLWASAVGLLTILLAVWLWMRESRRWVRWLGLAAVVGVVAQGVLGGIRVVAIQDGIGIFHGILAQLFLVLIAAIALFTSRWWKEADGGGGPVHARLRNVFFGVSLLVLLQLALGATMRHQHAGLAIWDFPLAHGQVWPATDADSVLRYNQLRGEVLSLNRITAFQIWLQMAHRLLAIGLFGVIAWTAWATARRLTLKSPVSRLAVGWFAVVCVQLGLGMATIWTNKSADIATAHVACGALTLVLGSTLALMAHRLQIDHEPVVVRNLVQPSVFASHSAGQQHA
jgi:cytochrome c oxidase assembly protein subunit 15